MPLAANAAPIQESVLPILAHASVYLRLLLSEFKNERLLIFPRALPSRVIGRWSNRLIHV